MLLAPSAPHLSLLSEGMFQGFFQGAWERLWLMKEQRECGCRNVFATTSAGQQTSVSVNKTKQPWEKVEFLGKRLGKGGSGSW